MQRPGAVERLEERSTPRPHAREVGRHESEAVPVHAEFATRHGLTHLRSLGADSRTREILRLQRAVGNAAVTSLLDMKSAGPAPEDQLDADVRSPTGAPASLAVQRKIGDGHDLSSPRFAGNHTLEAVFDNEQVLDRGNRGPAVTKVQQALIDFGFRLPKFGADATYGKETRAAVKSFQADAGIKGKDMDGVIGPQTMNELDLRAAAFPGPGKAVGKGAAPVVGGTGVSVTIPPKINATTTPEVMLMDRIPPRVDTPASIDVSGLAPIAQPVTLSIDGGSAANGTVTIDGAATKDLRGAATVNLRGGVQTAPGNAGNLRLVASQAGTEIARGAPFSVSAVPQFYSDAFVNDLLAGPRRGVVVQDGWESDSGNVADLDQVDISEQVEVTIETGCFAGGGGVVSGYLPGTVFTQDTHSSAAATLTAPGHRVAQQTCMFKDKRTGVTDIPMRDSGYLLDRRCIKVGPGFRFLIKKIGTATTANGVPSGAGRGEIIRPPQAV